MEGYTADHDMQHNLEEDNAALCATLTGTEMCLERMREQRDGVRAEIASKDAVIAAQTELIDALDALAAVKANYDHHCIHSSPKALADAVKRAEEARARLKEVQNA